MAGVAVLIASGVGASETVGAAVASQALGLLVGGSIFRFATAWRTGETPEQGKESAKVVATWIRDERLETLIPNEPKITSGQVVAHSDRALVAA